MTKFFCTYCGQKLSAKESMLGTFVACPACENSIEVPDFNKPQTNRFNTIPLSVPPPATPGGAIAAPATPVAVLPPPAAPPAVLPPPAAPAAVLPPPEPSAPLIPEPEPIPEQPLPPPPAASLPPAAPIPAPVTPAAALPPAVSVLSATPAVSAEQASAPAPPAIPSAPTPAPTYYPKPAEYTSPPAAPASGLPPADPTAAPAPAEAVPPPIPIPHLHHAPAPPVVQRKNPKLAAGLSIIPGLGQIYNGQIIIGICLFILTPILYVALLLGLLLHIYLVIDARRIAAKINAHPSGTSRLSLAIPPSHTWWMVAIAAAIAAAAVLTLIGLFTSEVSQRGPDTSLTKKAVHFSTPDNDGWVFARFHRLQLKLPSWPQRLYERPAENVAENLVGGTWDRRQTIVDDCYVDIVHGTFKEPADLQAVTNQSTMALAKLPHVSRMKSTTGETTISGRQAATLNISYYLEDEIQNINTLVIIEGHEIWYVHVMGAPQKADTYWKRIRASIRIDPL